MVAVEVCFRYGAVPGEREMRAIDRLWEVYGIRRIQFDSQEHIVRVEYDATRLSEPLVAGFLLRAGIEIYDPVALA